jgi:4-nitrophenyl phosphatase
MTLRGAIVDLDGTVYRGDEVIPGASEGLTALGAAGLQRCFVSNNPTRDGAAYLDRLASMGLAVDGAAACSAGDVTRDYLQASHADDDILCIGDQGLHDQLRDGGLSLTDDPADCDVLLASWTADFDYADMQRALAAHDRGTPFLGTDPDRTFPRPGGHVIPGSGAVIGAVARTVGREPDRILGKPSELAARAALDRLGVAAEECLVVGDRRSTDIAMGERLGMTTVQVETGVDVGADGEGIEPDYVIDALGDVETVLADEGSSAAVSR